MGDLGDFGGFGDVGGLGGQRLRGVGGMGFRAGASYEPGVGVARVMGGGGFSSSLISISLMGLASSFGA